MEKKLYLHEVLSAFNADKRRFQNICVSEISTDTRTIKRNAVFVAIKGDNFDGHKFVSVALNKKAICAIVDKKAKRSIPKKALNKCIEVRDAKEALGTIAKIYLSKFSPKIIAITGSTGKTSTKEMLNNILSGSFNVCSNIKSYNNIIGVSKTIFSLKKNDKFLVLEMGTNFVGEIASLVKIAKPDIALITNVGHSHIGFFKNKKQILKEKMSIFNGIKKSGIAIINADDPLIAKSARSLNCRKYFYSMNPHAKANFKCLSSKLTDRLTFKAEFLLNGKKVDVNIPKPAKHFIVNGLAAASIAAICGASLSDIKRGLSKNLASPMRMEIKKIQNKNVIIDCYNANPESTKEALKTLANLKKGRTLAILGDMRELGCHSKKMHSLVGAQVKKMKIDSLVAIGEYSKDIKKALTGSIKSFAYNNVASALPKIKTLFKESNWILIKGSRKLGLESILPHLEKTSGRII